MALWSAVLLVAAGSYALRVAPLLLGAGLRVSARSEAVLRDAAAGGITALLVAGTISLCTASTGPGPLAVVVPVLVAGWVARSGRSIATVMLAGAAAHMLIIAIVVLG